MTKFEMLGCSSLSNNVLLEKKSFYNSCDNLKASFAKPMMHFFSDQKIKIVQTFVKHVFID